MGWPGRLGLSTLFLIALAMSWAGFWLQSCSARNTAADRRRAQALDAAQPISVPPDAPDRGNDGRLVHVTGALEAEEPVVDPLLGVSADALALERHVEVYEWDQGLAAASPGRRAQDRLMWSRQGMEAEGFEQGADRPSRPRSARLSATAVRMGAFRMMNIGLPHELKVAAVPLPLSPDSLAELPEPLRQRARLVGDTIHVGDPAAPRAGDLRIRYSVAPARRVVTVVAGQTFWGLAPFAGPGGESIAIVKAGRHDARDVLRRAAAEAGGGIGTGYVLSIPFFALAAFLAYWPVRAAGRVLPGLGVLADAGALSFVLLGTVAVTAGAGAYARRAHGAGGAGWWALVAVAATGTLVLVGTRRRERLVAAAGAFAAPGAREDDATGRWYVHERGEVSGPFAMAEVLELASARLPRDTVVWVPSARQWTRAARVPAMAVELERRWGRRLPDPEPTFGEWLLAYYVTWPYHLIREALRIGRDMRGDRSFSRSDYGTVTVLAGITAFAFAVAAVEVLDFEVSPAARTGSRTLALLFAVLGLVVPAAVMVRASALRLREMGQGERRALWILVPGVNLLLWWQLVSTRGPSEPPEPERWKPIVPPPDTERRPRAS